MRIFIADDEPAIVDVLTNVCAQQQHSVASATNSMAAIDELRKNAVDLLVVDVAIGPPDGLQLIREARRAQPNLMVLAMTGYQGRYSLADVQAAGASDLIVKPLRMDEFQARLAFAEQRRRYIDMLNARRREVQDASARTIKALQSEVEELRRSARMTRDASRLASPHAEIPR